MKKIAVIVLLACLSHSGIGQVRTVNFQINHLAKGAPLSYSLVYQNDLQQDYRFTRIEYFITGFELSTDTGKVALVDSVCLINAAKPADYELGSIALEKIDSLHFHFGVDEERNHGDPSLYPLGHPLAPRDRYSMHWDWASGYRFWAVEGDADTTGDGKMDVSFQFHIAIDHNYLPASLETKVQSDESIQYLMNIDYADLMAGVDFRGEPVVHGGFGGPYDTPLDSMLARVRSRSCYGSGSQRVVSTSPELPNSGLVIYPNPAKELLTVRTDHAIDRLEILDHLGRTVLQRTLPRGEQTVHLSGLVAGAYLVRITDSARSTATRRLIIR